MAADTETPTNVVAALARVTAELGGIEKLTPQQRRARGQGGGDEKGVTYAYRGIDQIAAAAAPLLGKYGVVIVPTVEEQTVAPLEINGRPWTDTAVTMRWDVYGPGGVDDRLHAVTRGLGRDNSDKGPNKAATQAYKNLLLRLLCIGDPADDVDGHTHEADARRDDPPDEEWASREQLDLIRSTLNELPDLVRLGVGQWPELYGVELVRDKRIVASFNDAAGVLERLRAATVDSGSDGGAPDAPPAPQQEVEPTDPESRARAATRGA